MRHVAQPHINTARVEAYTASNARWLVALLAWIADVLERYAPQIAKCPLLREAAAKAKAIVSRDLRLAVRDLRISVVAHAVARMRFAGGRSWERLYPGNARGHARCARRPSRLCRRATAHLFRDMHRGALRQRAERLAACFANLAPLIARVLKRLAAMRRFPRTVRHALVVNNVSCAPLADAALAAFADTS